MTIKTPSWARPDTGTGDVKNSAIVDTDAAYRALAEEYISLGKSISESRAAVADAGEDAEPLREPSLAESRLMVLAQQHSGGFDPMKLSTFWLQVLFNSMKFDMQTAAGRFDIKIRVPKSDPCWCQKDRKDYSASQVEEADRKGGTRTVYKLLRGTIPGAG